MKRLALACLAAMMFVTACSGDDSTDDASAEPSVADTPDAPESDGGGELTGAQRFEAEYGYNANLAIEYEGVLAATGGTAVDFSTEDAADIAAEACEILAASDQEPADLAASGDVTLQWPDGTEMTAAELSQALTNVREICEALA